MKTQTGGRILTDDRAEGLRADAERSVQAMLGEGFHAGNPLRYLAAHGLHEGAEQSLAEAMDALRACAAALARRASP